MDDNVVGIILVLIMINFITLGVATYQTGLNDGYNSCTVEVSE